MWHTPFMTPWGQAILTWSALGLIRLDLPGCVRFIDSCFLKQEPFGAIQTLEGYFRGDLYQFELPLALEGTDFQLNVWRGLQAIPYGEVWSYQQLAEYIGAPNSARAVGNANHANPLPIIIPCHRVIRANGKLGGYGGGISLKRSLLELEGLGRR